MELFFCFTCGVIQILLKPIWSYRMGLQTANCLFPCGPFCLCVQLCGHFAKVIIRNDLFFTDFFCLFCGIYLITTKTTKPPQKTQKSDWLAPNNTFNNHFFEINRMAENSRMAKLGSKEDECVFSWKLFTGWDFMIGHSETAANRVASVVLGFKEALLEEAEKQKEKQK